MAGWFLLFVGVLLFIFRRSTRYQNWIKKRLTKKGFTKVEERVQSRIKMINMLAMVYIITGIVIIMNRL